MKTILLASTALFFVLASQAGATAPMGEATLQLDTAKLATVQLADSGNGHSGGSDDDGGSDDHGGSQGSVASQSIRVNVNDLEHLMTMVSELVLTRN